MGSYYIQSTTLTNIADAIRRKTGTISLMTPATMINEIQGLRLEDTDIPPEAYMSSTISEFSSNATLILHSAFAYCTSLTTVDLPKASYIGNGAFFYCRLLQSVSLPNVSYIGSYVFRYCYNLLSLYLGGTSVCSLAMSNAFGSTPIAGYTTSTGGVYGSIFVPASLLTSYQTATNWAAFSSRFVGI